MSTKATTNDIGMVISDALEQIDRIDLQSSPGQFGWIHRVDDDDPNNITITLDNGQTFVVRIIAGG